MMLKFHLKESQGSLKTNSPIGWQLNQHLHMEVNLDKRLERKISKWYGSGELIRLWLAKHWHRFISYGCPMCYNDRCDCPNTRRDINNPKGFAEMSEYCYKNYNHPYGV